ncbi:MAG: GNAT family N-acetyltransferase, partial [Acidobacteria bacterium]|nr:GNAT family N-acetyltransferase [Acidobacteriota bacterium]
EPFGSAQGKPVGWVALAPRPSYPVLGRSRVLQPVDEKPVWSITCFFVAKGYRGRGVATELLKAAVRYAKRRGARLVEGYPFEPRRGRLPDPFVWTGLPSMFLEARFHEVARRSPTRPIMRRVLPGHKGTKTQRI